LVGDQALHGKTKRLEAAVVLFRLAVAVVTSPQEQGLLVRDMQVAQATVLSPTPQVAVVVLVESPVLPTN
jgi:hypothetical protein